MVVDRCVEYLSVMWIIDWWEQVMGVESSGLCEVVDGAK